MDSQPDEELVESNANSRNWKGIGISLLVIIFVCLLILIAVLAKKPPKLSEFEQKPFSLDDIMYKNFETKRFNGIWTNDESFVYQTDHHNLMIFNCKTGKEKVLMSNNTIKQLVGDKFKFSVSNDPTFILIGYDMKNLYRHSIIARYKLFNTISNVSYDVLPTEVYSTDRIQNAVLSSNSRKLAFVYENNIYLMEEFFDGSKKSKKITHDGNDSYIYNGITDWLYEEEILYQTNAIWWSPDNYKLAYIKFNDSMVNFYEFPNYDGTPYGKINKIRYPKPDTPNPTARIYIYDTRIDSNIMLEIPNTISIDPNNCYIWSVKWLSENSLIVVYVNRRQNRAFTAIYDAASGSTFYRKDYPTAPMTHYDGWFLPHGLLASSRYNYYFQIWPYEGFKAIISFDTRSAEAHPVTNHNFDVIDMVSFNEKTGDLFYLATNGDPKQKHLFRNRVNDASRTGECLTCNSSFTMPFEDPSAHTHSLASENNCLYHSASFSNTGDYYVLECLGDRIPITYIKSAENSSYNYVLETNDELRHLVNSKILPRKSYLRVPLDNSTNFYADAEILYPPNFNPTQNIYPVLVYVYNGPTSQVVDYQFRIRKFETYLCVNYGIIIATIDGRGTDSNGDKFMKAVSKRLGELETLDQIALANALKKEIYTDNDRFAIWGWSYGGFLSSYALFQEKSPFKCAVSGAPVTDWLMYDSTYTERFLGSYAENRHAYERSNLTLLAKNNARFLGRRKMLLIHGTGDDNVHFQQSAVLTKVLRTTKLDLEFEVYPDVQHTPDEETQRHLYQKITKFLLTCYNINYHQFYEQLNYHHLINDVSTSSKSDDSE
ncbi:unnamed protein product [Brachionus calyciflorus]|uniref:Dipeptidylpeptidase 4 n=1 Tax=Brachionus calyciflorus TaxID=104777 RepID=A0A813SCY3_9BILA|nr:unnamed protein product [Brachionus calyciflorus]